MTIVKGDKLITREKHLLKRCSLLNMEMILIGIFITDIKNAKSERLLRMDCNRLSDINDDI